ncbi:type II toxin-antitoxin system RelE/ParE family toxin [Azospirillum agricola]|uniref:type II toxin-antitoxin system RelE/ParE family toxin n=1 Tax=Azospirillum agricola TaxID=1720247 RepID=UPI000A0F3999|nr:type II toxin-antitoxin system RelE/ParE family toxin [Azospirillum agricola]SMH63027.1 toxin ParE1/3/4 [Azospirillum lipoferum]
MTDRTAPYRLTRLAEQDVADILRASARRFGPVQRDRYAALIERAALMIAEQPARPGSRPRDELADGVRSFHVELAAGRRGAASHTLYYVPGSSIGLADAVLVLRVLHDAMEPGLHLSGGVE